MSENHAIFAHLKRGSADNVILRYADNGLAKMIETYDIYFWILFSIKLWKFIKKASHFGRGGTQSVTERVYS